MLARRRRDERSEAHRDEQAGHPLDAEPDVGMAPGQLRLVGQLRLQHAAYGAQSQQAAQTVGRVTVIRLGQEQKVSANAGFELRVEAASGAPLRATSTAGT